MRSLHFRPLEDNFVLLKLSYVQQVGWLDNYCLNWRPQRTLTFWVNVTFLDSFQRNPISNDLTKIEPRLFYIYSFIYWQNMRKDGFFFLSFFGIIGAYIQFELPAQVVAILWLATKQSSQVASNGKIDEELVHKVEQLQNFLFWEAPKISERPMNWHRYRYRPNHRTFRFGQPNHGRTNLLNKSLFWTYQKMLDQNF